MPRSNQPTKWKPREIPKPPKELAQLAFDAVVFKDRLTRARLWATVKKMDAVCKQIGWDIAEKMEQADAEG